MWSRSWTISSSVRSLARLAGSSLWGRSALALLVPGVATDAHDPTVAADHPALVADPLDARLDLHGVCLTPRPAPCRRARSHACAARSGNRPMRTVRSLVA